MFGYAPIKQLSHDFFRNLFFDIFCSVCPLQGIQVTTELYFPFFCMFGYAPIKPLNHDFIRVFDTARFLPDYRRHL